MKAILTLYVLVTAAVFSSFGLSAFLSLSTGNVAQGHIGSHSLVIGGVLNPLTHWSAGGMDYVFHKSVPSSW